MPSTGRMFHGFPTPARQAGRSVEEVKAGDVVARARSERIYKRLDGIAKFNVFPPLLHVDQAMTLVRGAAPLAGNVQGQSDQKLVEDLTSKRTGR